MNDDAIDLRGATIALTAALPRLVGEPRLLRSFTATNERSEVEDATDRVQRAVIAIVRATLARGGRIASLVTPPLHNLVAHVAAEYRRPDRLQRTEERSRRSVASLSIYLTKRGAIEADAGIFGRDAVVISDVRDRQNLMFEMIERERPVAIVCIGDDDAVRDDAGEFFERRTGRPMYAFSTTWHAEDRDTESAFKSAGCRLFDREQLGQLATLAEGLREEAVPYTLLSQMLVRDLLTGMQGGDRWSSDRP